MGDKKNRHTWNFFKSGGVCQVSVASGADIENIGKLDKKLWAALACPVRGLEFDRRTLEFLDADGDLRIRCNDIVSACAWVCSLLKDKDVLVKSPSSLKLSNIDDSTEEGALVLSSARRILENIGRPDADSIAVADFDNPAAIFAETVFNGDGVIIPESCGGDKALEKLVGEIAAFAGSKKDRSGKDGIDRAAAESFFQSAFECGSWLASRPALAGVVDAVGAYDSFKAVAEKIDDYFARAELAAFDPDAAVVAGIGEEAAAKNPASPAKGSFEFLRALPLAALSANFELDLSSKINPAWRAEISAFAKKVAEPILAEKKLSDENWKKLKAAFEPFAAWEASAPKSQLLEKLGAARISEIAAENRFPEIVALIEKDEAARAESDNVWKVEKLARLNMNLCRLLRNFVSFQDFYADKGSAIFQCGTLYIDSRACRLCVKVDNVAAHAAMAGMGYAFLLYCLCRRKGEADMNIAAVVSAGDADSLIVGRNGIFYDGLGREWDANVVKIIPNPIGVGEAFFAPYKRAVKWASEQIAKRAAAADGSVVANLTSKASDPKSGKIDIGTVAALGVAFGGITTAFGMILDAFLGLGYWIPLGIVGLILAVSLPSVIIAALKLRMRNIAPLLDGNGWAVNGKASVNMAFGAYLTQNARIPMFSKVENFDPFESGIRRRVGFALIVLIIIFGGLWYADVLKPLGLCAPSWSVVHSKKSAAAASSGARSVAEASARQASAANAQAEKTSEPTQPKPAAQPAPQQEQKFERTTPTSLLEAPKSGGSRWQR